MSKRILIVGCGQLGSRHLQAVASLSDVAEIEVFDTRPESLELGQERLREVPDLNTNIKFKWLMDLSDVSSNGDLCIVATQAKGRCQVIQDVVTQKGYRQFLIEKTVSQSVEEYDRLMDVCRAQGVAVWVNCKSRAYQLHQYINARIGKDERIAFTATAGDHGLVSNGIHEIDLFVFHDQSKELRLTGSRIDDVLLPSKRGPDVFDLSGTICAQSEKDSDFVLSFARGQSGPDTITILTPRFRFIVDHYNKYALESSVDQDWQWKQIPVDENYSVSHMSKRFANDILKTQTCELPTLADCYPAHKLILTVLKPYFDKLLNQSHELCPVT